MPRQKPENSMGPDSTQVSSATVSIPQAGSLASREEKTAITTQCRCDRNVGGRCVAREMPLRTLISAISSMPCSCLITQ